METEKATVKLTENVTTGDVILFHVGSALYHDFVATIEPSETGNGSLVFVGSEGHIRFIGRGCPVVVY